MSFYFSRLATRFRLPALQDLAISHLKTSLDERTAGVSPSFYLSVELPLTSFGLAI